MFGFKKKRSASDTDKQKINGALESAKASVDAGQYAQGIAHYKAHLEAHPKDAQSWVSLAHALQNAGQFNNALSALRQALPLSADNARHKSKVLQAYASLFKEYQDFEVTVQLSNELNACFEDEHVNNSDLALLSLRLCFYQALIIGLTPIGLDHADHSFDLDGALKSPKLNWEDLSRPEFLDLLASALARDTEFERRLTALRKHLLSALSQDNSGKSLWDGALHFIDALACQCYINEYVFAQTPEEVERLAALETRVINGESLTLFDIAIYACYKPLHALPRAADMHEKLKPLNVLQNTVKMQLTDPLNEKEIKENLHTVTPIDDEISKIVKAQYEENPYPRWLAVSGHKALPIQDVLQFLFPHMEDERFKHVNQDCLRTLIAGCGTGKQSIDTALTFANSNILAIDLSTSSLAYAKQRTQEFGIEGIEYAIGDLLKTKELGEQFDVIQCGGVLHHLHDPMKGWKALYDCVKPGGFMMIALYSERARQCVVAAREFIKEHGYTSSAEDIRTCREEIKALPDDHPVKPVSRRNDFFTTSCCRDLIFHVQEHRYTPLQLKSMIKELGLDFLGFHLQGTGTNTLEKYRALFPEDTNATNLENWDAFEDLYPDTFKGMFQFWMQKPA